jgi:hypothetical protein
MEAISYIKDEDPIIRGEYSNSGYILVRCNFYQVPHYFDQMLKAIGMIPKGEKIIVVHEDQSEAILKNKEIQDFYDQHVIPYHIEHGTSFTVRSTPGARDAHNQMLENFYREYPWFETDNYIGELLVLLNPSQMQQLCELICKSEIYCPAYIPDQSPSIKSAATNK